MDSNQSAWYCIRTLQKHEHIAAGHLRQFDGVEVFCPQLRASRRTRSGSIRVNEPVFPGYLFARFPLQRMLGAVRYTPGVKHVVTFGDRWPFIPDGEIEQLRQALEAAESSECPPAFAPGETVEILDGPFLGLSAVVERHLPAIDRVRVLLDVLGRATSVELAVTALSAQQRFPQELLWAGAAA